MRLSRTQRPPEIRRRDPRRSRQSVSPGVGRKQKPRHEGQGRSMTNIGSFLTRAVQHVDLVIAFNESLRPLRSPATPTPAHQRHTAPTTTHARPTPQITLPRLAGHEYKPAPSPDPRTGGAKVDDPRPCHRRGGGQLLRLAAGSGRSQSAEQAAAPAANEFAAIRRDLRARREGARDPLRWSAPGIARSHINAGSIPIWRVSLPRSRPRSKRRTHRRGEPICAA